MRPNIPVVKIIRRVLNRVQIRRARHVRAARADLRADIKGATAVEYGLILAVLVVAMLVGFTTLADNTTSIWNMVNTKVANAR